MAKCRTIYRNYYIMFTSTAQVEAGQPEGNRVVAAAVAALAGLATSSSRAAGPPPCGLQGLGAVSRSLPLRPRVKSVAGHRVASLPKEASATQPDEERSSDRGAGGKARSRAWKPRRSRSPTWLRAGDHGGRVLPPGPRGERLAWISTKGSWANVLQCLRDFHWVVIRKSRPLHHGIATG